MIGGLNINPFVGGVDPEAGPMIRREALLPPGVPAVLGPVFHVAPLPAPEPEPWLGFREPPVINRMPRHHLLALAWANHPADLDDQENQGPVSMELDN